MSVFGKEKTKAPEYWIDNSMYSNYTRPPKLLRGNPEQIKKDIAFYKSLGIRDAAAFACHLGQDYEAIHGEPDIQTYTRSF